MSRPNIVLMMADDFGFELLGCNGGQSYDTPNFDQWSEEGLRFTHCFSQPLCTPSRVQIMTGRYNDRNYTAFSHLDPREKSFANLLKDAGYATAVVGKWQLTGAKGTDTQRPRHFGFDEWCLWNTIKTELGNARYANPVLNIDGEFQDFPGRYGPDVIFEHATDFLKRQTSEQPFLLYYPMVLTHAPFEKTPDSDGWNPGQPPEDSTDNFGDMVAYTDKIVGKMRTLLADLGLAENTILLFTGDNGTDRRVASTWNNCDYPGGKGNMWVPGTHVPLLADWPGTIPQGNVCEDLIDFSDVLPTLCDLAGVELPAEIEFDGRSFAPQLRGEKGSPRDWVYVHYHARKSNYGHRRYGRFAGGKTYKLYMNGTIFNIDQDWLEEHPIEESSAEVEAICARLQEVLNSRPSWDESVTLTHPEIEP